MREEAITKPSVVAKIVVLEAVKLGYPVEVRVLSDKTILLKRDNLAGVVFVRTIKSDNGFILAAYPDRYSAWSVRLALLRRDGTSPAELYPQNVPLLGGFYPHMFSTFEVDVWRTRISLVSKLRPSSRVPEPLSPYKVLGGRVFYLPDTMDYAAVRGEVILAWYNDITGKLDDAIPYLLKAGFLDKSARLRQ